MSSVSALALVGMGLVASSYYMSVMVHPIGQQRKAHTRAYCFASLPPPPPYVLDWVLFAPDKILQYDFLVFVGLFDDDDDDEEAVESRWARRLIWEIFHENLSSLF